MEKFEELKLKAKAEIEKIASMKTINDVKAKFIGKNGEITALLRGMKDIPAEMRAAFGKRVNDLKEEVSAFFAKKETETSVSGD